jgi:predicted nuclease of predicted toxin-antitoxin system
MKFKCDENLPQEVTVLLQEQGFDALSIYDQSMVGALDTNIASVCRTEGRVIVTLDTDFADIRAYPPNQHSGIIVLRIRRHDKPYVLAVMQRVIKALADNALEQRLWIVDEERIRIRTNSVAPLTRPCGDQPTGANI